MTFSNCNVCKFFANSMLGNCHRYPQAITKNPTDWCGEFVVKKQQPEILELPVVNLPQVSEAPVTKRKYTRKVAE